MKLHIAENFSLPVDAVTQTFAFLAKRGMGKTYAAGVLVEEMAKSNAQVVVIDPTDSWWGLKSSADGKSEGYPFIIFGGNHADVPLMPEAGKLLAEFVVETGQSVIICTRLLSKTKARFAVADFFEHLYHLKGQAGKQSPIFVTIDECDLFVPQFVEGETARCVGAIDDVVRRGRTSGLGVCLISQRAAKVNKDVLSQVEVLVALQTGGTHDRKALKEWIEANADADKMQEFIENLVKLQRGQAWVWSPSWLQVLQQITFRKKETFDSSYTPRAGETRIEPRKLAPVDLEKVKAKMAATIERVKQDDPRELRKEIANLKRESASKPLAEGVQRQLKVLNEELLKEVERADKAELALRKPVAVLKDGQISRLEKLMVRGETISSKISDGCEALRIKLASAFPVKPPPASLTDGYRPRPIGFVPRKVPQLVSAVVNRREFPKPHPDNGDWSPTTCQKRILQALSQNPSGCDMKKLLLLSRYSMSGPFAQYMRDLRERGCIEGENTKTMTITEIGKTYGPFEKLPEGNDLIEHWKKRFGTCGSKIIDALILNPDGLDMTSLLESTGYSMSGPFSQTVRELRVANVLTGKNTETMKLSEELLEALNA